MAACVALGVMVPYGLGCIMLALLTVPLMADPRGLGRCWVRWWGLDLLLDSVCHVILT